MTLSLWNALFQGVWALDTDWEGSKQAYQTLSLQVWLEKLLRPSASGVGTGSSGVGIRSGGAVPTIDHLVPTFPRDFENFGSYMAYLDGGTKPEDGFGGCVTSYEGI